MSVTAPALGRIALAAVMLWVSPSAWAEPESIESTAPAIAAPDRSSPPPVAPPVARPQPEVQRRVLRPGVELAVATVPGLRKARVSLVFERGSRQIAGGPSASYDAFGWVWDQATQRRSGDELAIFEDVHDVDVWSTSSMDRTTVHLDAPLDALPQGLELLGEVVRQPRFQRRDLRLIRENRLNWWIVESSTDGGALVEGGLDHLWVPQDHPLSARPDVVGWRDLRRRDVRRHHRDLLDSAPLTVLVVGDLDLDEAAEWVEPVVAGLGVPGDRPQPPPFRAPTSDQVIGVDLAGTGRASMGVRMAAPTLEHPDAPAFRLIDHAMGGQFLSRLNADLREARGLTYGISSRYGAGRSAGTWTIITEVSLDDAQEAIQAIREQLDRLAEGGLTPTELDDAVRSRISGWNAGLRTTGGAASVFGSRVAVGWTTARARERLDAYGQVAPSDSRRVAQAWVQDQPRAWVIVGERSALDPQLQALGLDVAWLPGELVVLGAGVGPVQQTQGNAP